MKIIALLFLVLIPSLSFAQDKANALSGWEIGIVFSPDFYLNSSTISTDDYSGYEILPSAFNYTTGLQGTFSIANKTDVGIGLQYSNKDYNGLIYCHTCDFIFEIEEQNIKQRFIDIPVFIRQHIIQKKDWIEYRSWNNL